uniref:Uncharacterized protein n=1 Tax=Mycena chlorophos TaxID=658473 RepID=A0ABQ0LSX8_MYCCL|nr:predicted protein [Mycena chlorophos]
MSADLVDAFWENFFSVDMEDDARIITFRPLPENALKLFTHLSRRAREITDAKMWTLNLRWSLRVNWDIGDARFDYPDEDIEDYFPLAEKDLFFTHERWKHGIARHFRDVMESY